MDHWRCADPIAQTRLQSLRPVADLLPEAIPGRRPGAKNRTTLLATALLEGQKEALLRTAIQLALAGDVVMLKFLLEPLLPRERPVTIELPEMVFADDGVEALGSIMRAVSEGAITPSEGAKLATIVKSYTDAIDNADVVKRVRRNRESDKGSRTMRDARFRQIARLQKFAQPFLSGKAMMLEQWELTIRGAANHAAVLVFLIRYGKPQIDEPLSRL